MSTESTGGSSNGRLISTLLLLGPLRVDAACMAYVSGTKQPRAKTQWRRVIAPKALSSPSGASAPRIRSRGSPPSVITIIRYEVLCTTSDDNTSIYIRTPKEAAAMTTYAPSLALPYSIFANPAASVLLPIALGTTIGYSVKSEQPFERHLPLTT